MNLSPGDVKMIADTHRMVGNMEGQLASVVRDQQDHNKRIRKLESFRTRVLGVFVVVGSIGTWIGNLIFKR